MHEFTAQSLPNHPIARRHGGRVAASVAPASMVLGREPIALGGFGFLKRGFVPAGLIFALRRSGTRAE
ncbi:hypothetical protein [Salinibacterium xinjiangense]|uniref:hypothetical protein n=1 Tax=Salinibacterium xinjiangense TaxID=386302 RepID=UPI00166E9CB3|nr:hypothetical protein [Salinibacterium xinjiangense]